MIKITDFQSHDLVIYQPKYTVKAIIQQFIQCTAAMIHLTQYIKVYIKKLCLNQYQQMQAKMCE